MRDALALLRSAAMHDGHAHAPASAPLPLTWTWDPLVAGALVVAALAYIAGVRRVWRRAGRGHGVRPHEVACAALAWGALVVALLSPLDGLSDVLFSAHMSQHELLMLVAAPLVVIGRPFVAILWALPAAARERVAAFVKREPVQRAWDVVTHPVVALAVHALVRWLWHAPAFYEAALHSEGVHAVQHATFFLSASAFWWALVHGRYGRAGYGVGVLFVFATAVHAGALAALVTFADSAWYPEYVERGAAHGVDAVADQHLAGLVMWVPAGAVMIIAGLALFAAWLGEVARRSRAVRA